MKKKNEAFSRLLDWLENGDQALDNEMEDDLYDLPQTEKQKTKKKNKAAKRNAGQKKRAASPRRAYADSWWYRLCAAAVCLSLIGLLLYAVVRMPEFGNADTLIDSELTEFYVEHTLEETGAVNIVTGIILDYRGFDTLGESHVLFIAVCTVLLMLSVRGEKNAEFRLRANE